MAKLILGTHNSDKWPSGLLDTAYTLGIRQLDCASAYPPLPPGSGRFGKVWKLGVGDSVPQHPIVLAHYAMDYAKLSMSVVLAGASLYYPAELAVVMQYDPKVLQVPYKPFKMWLPHLKRRGVEVHVRKVFADDCYEEALRNPDVDAVVFGVDNADQLLENVERWEVNGD